MPEGGENGFTLLEVMIGLAILAGAVTTLVSAFNYHLRVASEDRDLVMAAVLGRLKAEEAALSGLPKTLRGAFDGDLNAYKWEMAPSDTDFPGLKRLDVRISWDGSKSLTLSSYFQE